ncbi:MAG: helix-turn-helix domain-containing protein [Verrucomicrobia bacterium]|nr:helix-turn-helix domain-containing protein [Verrucomicrobiota bacterium]
MASVAEQLRVAREKRKLTVYDVAAATKIRTDHVRALEDGNYRVFAAAVYIKGFVRSYSNLLKLDTPRVMADLAAELSATKEFSEPSSLAGRPMGLLDSVMLWVSKLNWQLVIVVLGGTLILALGFWAYRAWQRHQTADPLSGLGSGLYQPAQTNAGEVLPLPRPNP